jgi:poly-gamma-glutamate synthesis protein (capsule biosynthesis protein)
MANSTGQLTITATGDIYIQRDAPTSAFHNLIPVFSESDIVFGNLETALIDKPPSVLDGRTSPMVAREEVVNALVSGGFNIVSLANNHTTDYGPLTLLNTMEVLRQHNISFVGAGRESIEAEKPKILSRNGVSCAFLAYEATVWSFKGDAKEQRPGVAKLCVNSLLPLPHVAEEDLSRLEANIKGVRDQADIVVLSMHWGAELTTTLSPHQLAIAHAAVDSGADIILGHHPHVLQGIEQYKGGLIFYSLGNTIFDREFHYPADTMVVTLTIKEELIQVQIIPVYLDEHGNLHLLVDNKPHFQKTLNHVRKLSSPLGFWLSSAGTGVVERL